jgi:hypothetical protein
VVTIRVIRISGGLIVVVLLVPVQVVAVRTACAGCRHGLLAAIARLQLVVIIGDL